MAKWIQLMVLLGPQFKQLLPIILQIIDTIVSNLETKMAASKQGSVMKAESLPAADFQKCVDACVQNCQCTEEEAKQLCSQLPVVGD